MASCKMLGGRGIYDGSHELNIIMPVPGDAITGDCSPMKEACSHGYRTPKSNFQDLDTVILGVLSSRWNSSPVQNFRVYQYGTGMP